MVCFSFAAYSKTLIDHLKSLNIPVLPGLTDSEFSFIESTFHFSFPSDLRSILQAGVPIGPHFPNWRSSSLQQLHLLLSLPSLNLTKNISHNNFWVSSIWGPKPKDSKESVVLAKQFLEKAPILVPIYRNCYIPCAPNLAGNPVFYIDDRGVRVLSFDISRFFQQVEFLKMGTVIGLFPAGGKGGTGNIGSMNAPAWAATSARNIDFWTDAAESGRRMVAREDTRGWWCGGDFDRCMEEVFWRLRDGGWGEEEVREMMMMDGCDHRHRQQHERIIIKEEEEEKECCGAQFDEEEEEGGVTWHHTRKVLSLVLLRAGWSREDVVYSLGLQDSDDDHDHLDGTENLDGKINSSSFLDFPFPINLHNHSCSREDDDHPNSHIQRFMKVPSLEV